MSHDALPFVYGSNRGANTAECTFDNHEALHHELRDDETDRESLWWIKSLLNLPRRSQLRCSSPGGAAATVVRGGLWSKGPQYTDAML